LRFREDDLNPETRSERFDFAHLVQFFKEKRMNINLHIERLILDGLPLEARDSAALRAAVEGELARLLSQNADISNWRTGGATPSVSAAAIQLAGQSNPMQIGQQIAGSIYGGISKAV
jgi:tRNA threonylcarbamoyladenosine modification (KEOPS) complex  Pcc1 subunit